MSGKALEWAFNQLPSLKDATEKLVLLRLAWRADKSNQAWPGHDKTAADLNISRRSVQRSIKNLEKFGLIEVHIRRNDTSIFTMNVQHSLKVSDIMSPTFSIEPILRVTPCRKVGDTMSPPEVTPCHPNKQVNQSVNKQQPIVVVSENLIWDKPLTDEEKAACTGLLIDSRLDLSECQKFIDEMAGFGRKAPIRNPAAWMANMIARLNKPGFAFGYAEQVAAGRARRAEQARRKSLSVPPKPTISAPPKKLSDVGRKALAALGKHPKLVPACHQSVPL